MLIWWFRCSGFSCNYKNASQRFGNSTLEPVIMYERRIIGIACGITLIPLATCLHHPSTSEVSHPQNYTKVGNLVSVIQSFFPYHFNNTIVLNWKHIRDLYNGVTIVFTGSSIFNDLLTQWWLKLLNVPMSLILHVAHMSGSSRQLENRQDHSCGKYGLCCISGEHSWWGWVVEDGWQGCLPEDWGLGYVVNCQDGGWRC